MFHLLVEGGSTYNDSFKVAAKAFYHLFAYRCFNLIIDNRHFKQQLHGRSLQLRKYALLDDLFNNQRNSHDQIGFHIGKRLEDNLRARHAGEEVNLATYRKFIQELESQSVHVCHRQHGYDLITCFQWKDLESESRIRP